MHRVASMGGAAPANLTTRPAAWRKKLLCLGKKLPAAASKMRGWRRGGCSLGQDMCANLFHALKQQREKPLLRNKVVQFSRGCMAGGTGRAGQHLAEGRAAAGGAAVTPQCLRNSSATTPQFETIYLHNYRQFCAPGMHTQCCYSRKRGAQSPQGCCCET